MIHFDLQHDVVGWMCLLKNQNNECLFVCVRS